MTKQYLVEWTECVHYAAYVEADTIDDARCAVDASNWTKEPYETGSEMELNSMEITEEA